MESSEEYRKTVADLFWDWYFAVYVELWEDKQRVKLNDRAKARAATLGIKYKFSEYEPLMMEKEDVQ